MLYFLLCAMHVTHWPLFFPPASASPSVCVCACVCVCDIGSDILVAANNQIKPFRLGQVLTCGGYDKLLINRYIYSLGQKFRTFKWEFFSSLPGEDR